jgi:hypothetical protein
MEPVTDEMDPTFEWVDRGRDPRPAHEPYFYNVVHPMSLSDGRQVRAHLGATIFGDPRTISEYSPVWIEDIETGKFTPVPLQQTPDAIDLVNERPSQTVSGAMGDVLCVIGHDGGAYTVSVVSGAVQYIDGLDLPNGFFASGGATFTLCGSQCLCGSSTCEGEDVLIFFGGGCTEGGTGHRTLAFRPFAPECHLQEIPCTSPPPSRLYHGACRVRDRYLCVFGGAPDAKNTKRDDVVFNDLWFLDVQERRWREMPRPAANANGSSWPRPRGSVTLAFIDPHVYLIGGFDGAGAVCDAWRFHVDREQWSTVPMPPWIAREHGLWAYAMCPNARHDQLLFWGGATPDDTPATDDADTSFVHSARSMALRVPRTPLAYRLADFIRQNLQQFDCSGIPADIIEKYGLEVWRSFDRV